MARHGPIEWDEPILGREEKADDRAHTAGQCEEGEKETIDDMMRGLCNVSEMREFFHLLGFEFQVFVKEGENECGEEERAVQWLRGWLFDFRIDFSQYGGDCVFWLRY